MSPRPLSSAERRGRHLLVRVGAVAALVVVVSVVSAPFISWAAWTSRAVGPARAVSQSVPQGPAPVAVAVGSSVTVSWSETVLSGGTSATGYRLTRYPAASGTPAAMSTTCTGVIAGLSCVETGVPPGSWRYTVTPVHNGWTGAESAFGSAVSVGVATLAFSSSTTIPAASLPLALAGTVTNFLSGEALSFRLDSATGAVLSGTPTAVAPDGSATISVTIPAGTDNSPHSVFAVGAGGTTASAAFTILDPPVLSSLEMFDVTANGKVDRVVATFSKPLAPYTAGTVPWTLANAPSGASLASVSVTGSVATLTLAEGAGAASTAVGTFTVALAANSAGIRDLNGFTASFAATAPVDKAAPAPVTAPLMNDGNANGKVDQVTMTLSEPLAAYSAGTAPWTLANVPSAGTLSAAAATTGGTAATLTVAEGAGAADTAVGGFTISVSASATGLRDAAGNQTSFTGVVPADKAKPARVSQAAFDANANGRFDRVDVTFSESLAAYTAGGAPWTMTSAPAGTAVASAAALGATASLTLVESTAVATAVGSWRIALAASATGVRDAAGNQSSYAAVAPTDAAAPVVVSMTMQDLAGGNGIVDRVAIVFSETLATYSAGLTPWTLANVPSGSSLSTVARTGSTLNLTLATPTGAGDTTVGSFTVAMAANAAGARDAAGNQASFAARAPTDGAGPAALTLSSVGGAIAGRIAPGDSLSVLLSEPLGPAVTLPATTTITMTDPSTTASDTVTIPGLFNGARSTGSNSYLATDNTSAAFGVSTFSLSADRRTVTVTVGPTCAGTGCATLGTAAAANVSVLLDATLRDAVGVVPTTVARNISARLF